MTPLLKADQMSSYDLNFESEDYPKTLAGGHPDGEVICLTDRGHLISVPEGGRLLQDPDLKHYGVIATCDNLVALGTLSGSVVVLFSDNKPEKPFTKTQLHDGKVFAITVQNCLLRQENNIVKETYFI